MGEGPGIEESCSGPEAGKKGKAAKKQKEKGRARKEDKLFQGKPLVTYYLPQDSISILTSQL